jgi:hypothetical protein
VTGDAPPFGRVAAVTACWNYVRALPDRKSGMGQGVYTSKALTDACLRDFLIVGRLKIEPVLGRPVKRGKPFLTMIVSPLVIINDFNFKGITNFKTKTDAPLVVNANAPLAGAIMSQRFQPKVGLLFKIECWVMR